MRDDRESPRVRPARAGDDAPAEQDRARSCRIRDRKRLWFADGFGSGRQATAAGARRRGGCRVGASCPRRGRSARDGRWLVVKPPSAPAGRAPSRFLVIEGERRGPRGAREQRMTPARRSLQAALALAAGLPLADGARFGA